MRHFVTHSLIAIANSVFRRIIHSFNHLIPHFEHKSTPSGVGLGLFLIVIAPV